MKLIEPKAEYIPQTDLYKHIELCGRTAYKSEDKITEDSAKGFVDRMVKSKHGAVLEHGTVYLEIDSIAEKDLDRIVGRHKLWTLDDVQDSLRTNPTYNKYGEENWWAKNASHIAKCMFNKYATNQYSNVNVVLKEHELNTDDRIVITPTSGYPDVRAVSGKIFSKFNAVFITTNLRVLIENEWLDDLKYLCEPTEFHEKRYTIKFTTDRGVSHKRFVA